MSVLCCLDGVCRLYYEGKAGSEANTTQALKVQRQIAQPPMMPVLCLLPEACRSVDMKS